MGLDMEPLLQAWSCFRRRKFQRCAQLCGEVLETAPYDQDNDPERLHSQAAWSLKTRALTEMVYVDEVDVDQEGIAEMMLDENAIAQVARPGTSLKLPVTGQVGGPSPAVRPVTQSGRPVTGFVRPSTQSSRPGTMEQAIRTPRTSHTARPVTSASGRYVRLGTASMLTNPEGPFINISRLNLAKYAQKPNLAKALFEYIFHHENDVKNALDLAALATEHSQFKDWWWKVQLGKCYYRLGLYREAEKQFKSALKHQDMIDIFLFLAKQGKMHFGYPGQEHKVISAKAEVYTGLAGALSVILQAFPKEGEHLHLRSYTMEKCSSIPAKWAGLFSAYDFSGDSPKRQLGLQVYIRLDQPITALQLFKQGLDRFPGEVSLLCGIARIYEEMNDFPSASEYYKDVLKQDNTHVEAIACIGSNYFYSDQPETALRFYRRLLQMGVYNCQLYNNLGLCCFYAQQYDLTLSSFERALSLSENEEETADVWYNLGHVAVGIGDLNLAYQCFKLALANNNDHAEAYNNLAVLEMRKNHVEQARALLQTASSLAPHMYEPHFNFAALSDQVGDLQSSYVAAQKAQAAFPEHVNSKQLIQQLKLHFAAL